MIRLRRSLLAALPLGFLAYASAGAFAQTAPAPAAPGPATPAPTAAPSPQSLDRLYGRWDDGRPGNSCGTRTTGVFFMPGYMITLTPTGEPQGSTHVLMVEYTIRPDGIGIHQRTVLSNTGATTPPSDIALLVVRVNGDTLDMVEAYNRDGQSMLAELGPRGPDDVLHRCP
jgi:hypothetical protein